MSRPRRPSVAVLGGGMAALTSAFELSEGNWKDRFDRITVYQRGWRLGGKGASSRGINGRIEEHGLHLLLGYYDQTFEVMRRCYEELDRPNTDPRCPIRSWEDAVQPANRVGVTEFDGERWTPWLAEFTATSGQPGANRPVPSTPAETLFRSFQLLADFLRSLAPPPAPRHSQGVHLSASPIRHAGPSRGLSDAKLLVRGAATLGLIIPLSLARRLQEWTTSKGDAAAPGMAGSLADLQAGLRRIAVSDKGMRRSLELVEVVTANAIGILAEGLMVAADGFSSIDHLDYREWLQRHGIDPAALESPLIRGMYDLTFAYEGGNPSRPRFSAGLGLQLATRMLLQYSGGVFWRMQAGMGEIIFAPLYQVLRRRGVDFKFFHRVDSLRVSSSGQSIEAIELGLQAEPVDSSGYSPLMDVKGLPCWPEHPLTEHLQPQETPDGVDFESFWAERDDRDRVILRDGRDFDQIVFAISVGMIPYICQELLDHSSAWREVAENLGTVATQSVQLWLTRDERDLGWVGDAGDIVSGFTEPFDTWASMSHLIDAEDWPSDARPGSIAYFCSCLSDDVATEPATASAQVLESARDFLDREVKALWPGAVGPSGFRWDLLCGPSGKDAMALGALDGGTRLRTQYWRANIDPSDRYVQSLPGTARFRIAPGSTGFANLVVAGDWTDCGLNAGCLEAATLSGQLAAAALLQRAEQR